MIVAVVLSFACLSVGILLIGIATIKDAFTPTVVTRTEAGAVAVEERRRA